MLKIAARGKMLQQQFLSSLRAFKRGPASIGEVEVLEDIRPNATLINGLTFDQFVTMAGRVLKDSGRVYRWEDTVVFEYRDPANESLRLLASGGSAEPGAAGVLANIVVASSADGKNGTLQYPLPESLARSLLVNEGLRRELPVIRQYARRPLYDPSFTLCQPGWNAEAGILVHGPEIEPDLTPPAFDAQSAAIDRLPPVIRQLLQEFCWASDADLVNGLALLLTGFLSNHFIDDPKPIAIIDGNQPGVGKTLFIQVVGRILDGEEPSRIPLGADEELEKKLGAAVRAGRSGLFFFDNVRAQIDSPLIEAKALSPVLSFRVLGQSTLIKRPNTYLWVVTSNQTGATADLVARALPIRLRFDGNPRDREFTDDPPAYAMRNREAIIGELAGLVERWKRAGKPPGPQKHRCANWARIIGGILQVAGLHQLLANVEEAEAVMDEGLQTLATLAEYFIARNDQQFYIEAGQGSDKDVGGLPRDWVPAFQQVEALSDKLKGKTPKGRDTVVGTFLAGKVGRRVEINLPDGLATVTLKVQAVRRNQKKYHFEVEPIQDAGVRELGPEPAAVPVNGQAHRGLLPEMEPKVHLGAAVLQPQRERGAVASERLATVGGNDLKW